MRHWISRREALQISMAGFLPSFGFGHAKPPETAHAPERPVTRLDLAVAGPADGFLQQWGNQLAPYLQQGLDLTRPVNQEEVGGADGLTGANRFGAKMVLDGSAALLLPGAALLAWLCGDAKVQFDISQLIPMLAASAPCLVVGRADLAGLPINKRVRAAASRPGGIELPMLLALDQLKVAVQPVYGLENETDIVQAYADHSVDVVFLHGGRVPQSLARLTGAQPLMTLTGGTDLPSLFPSTPRYEQLRAVRPPPTEDLSRALQAVVLATALDMTLMIPQLVPADAVAQWRRAAQNMAGSLSLRAYAAELSEQLAAGVDAENLLKPLQIDSETQLKLRKWVGARFPWKSG